MENNNADGAWTDAAKKAIAERSVLVMRHVAERRTTIEAVEHDVEFVAEIAEHLKVMKILDNAFDYAAGGDSGPSEERLRDELAVIDANPIGAEPGGPDDTHGLSQRQLLGLSFEGAPEDVLDSSDPRDKQIGELSRAVIELREQLAQRVQEVEDGAQEHSKLQTMAAGLNHKIANNAVMLTGLDQEVSELKAELRKVKRDHSGLKTLVSQTAAYIAKAAPRTPSAKRTAFLKLANDLDKKVGISKKTPAKKTPAKKTPAKKR